jgi:hypothetical protein
MPGRQGRLVCWCSLAGPTPSYGYVPLPTAPLTASRSVPVATIQSCEDPSRHGVCSPHRPCPGLRNDLSSLATPVDPVLSRTVEAHLKIFLAHAAWAAEHGDAGM